MPQGSEEAPARYRRCSHRYRAICQDQPTYAPVVAKCRASVCPRVDRRRGLAVALAVAVAWPFFTVPAEGPETHVDIDTPDMPEPTAFEISPDGRRLVFVAFRNGQPQLLVRSLDGTTAQPLEGTEGGRLPFWSPDSRSLGFFVPGSLKVIDLTTAWSGWWRASTPGMGGAWGPDWCSHLPRRTPVHGTSLRRRASRRHHTRRWSHDPPVPGVSSGRPAVPVRRDGDRRRRGDLSRLARFRETTRLTAADTNGVYVSPGWLLFGRQGALVARRFDPARRALSGDPVTVDRSVAVGPVVPCVAASASTAA